MCYKLYNLIRSTRDRNLTQLQKSIMLSLASRANQKWDNIWPSYGLIAKDVGCSRVSAVNNITQLVEKGYLIKTKRVIDENLPYGMKRIIKNSEDIGRERIFSSNQYWIVLEKFGIKSSSNSPIKEIVDNSVDKGVDNKGIREYPEQQAVLGDSVHDLPRGGKGDLSYRSYHTTIIKNHDVDEGFKREILDALLKMHIKKSDALRWVLDERTGFGVHRIYSLLSLIKILNRDEKTKIRNPGAYIRTILEGKKRVA